MSDVTWFADKKNKLRRVMQHAQHRAAGNREVVVTLTSYPPRIGTVWHSVRSIFGQSYLPDRIVLYLAKSDFPNREKDLPQSLLDMLWHDFEIRWVDEDLKPHKKYYWAFKDFRDSLVVTIDDDLVYRKTMIQELVEAFPKHPDAIIASRTHLIMFNEDGSIKPYDQWIYEAPYYHPALVGIPSMRLFATTGAGTLFNPSLFPELTFDIDLIKRHCLAADDVWLKAVETIAGIPVVAATNEQLLEYVPGTQDVALCHVNTESGGNDAIMGSLFGELEERGLLPVPFDQLVQDQSLDCLLS